MVLILDDTFNERSKYNDVEYLKEVEYINICHVYCRIPIDQISLIEKELSFCKVFCFHKSLQFFDNDLNPLKNEINLERRETLINLVSKQQIPKVEFSLGETETQIKNKKINKKIFYDNLRPFLDNYIEKKMPELKILFYGENYEKVFFDDLCTKTKSMIRHFSDINEFPKNQEIIKNLKIIFNFSDSDLIEWFKQNNSIENVIRFINKQNSKRQK
jgi:hypothetical protein